MGTTNGQITAPTPGTNSSCHRPSQGSGGWLGGRRSLAIAGGVTAAGTAVAIGQHWLAAADLVPLLFALPCAAMMFMCMKGMNHGQQAGNAPSSTGTATSSASDPRS